MLRKILYASDLGPFSSQILEHVIGLAGANDAQVRLLHVVEPVSALTHNLMLLNEDDYRPNYAAEMNRRIRDEVLADLRSDYLAGHQALSAVDRVEVKTGQPADTILKESQVWGADLIVIGSHNHNLEAADKLGRVASNVLHHSQIPVYMVPIFKRKPETSH